MQKHAHLIFLFKQLLGRELASRYRTTALGSIWLVLQPLLMLGVYTLVFSGIFKVKWTGAATTSGFALVLFAGLIVFTFFSDVLVTAPSLISSQPNYVKKVVFPVGILAVVRVAAAYVTALVGLAILIVAQCVSGAWPNGWVIVSPIILAELIPMLLGIAWLMSALGVYLRDIAQFTGIISSVMLFVSPIFFPPTAIPEQLRALVDFNPLVLPMGALRAVTVQGQAPEWAGLATHFLVSCAFAWMGYFVFRRLSRGFSDVL